MKVKLFFLSLLFFLPILPIESQINQIPSAVSIMERLKQTLVEYDTCHYTAEMRFKEMGGDTFEVRNYRISIRGNPSNKLYGYDWLVVDKDPEGLDYATMITPDTLYAIYEWNEGISHRPLPFAIDVGTYQETMRTYFVVGEVLASFIDVDPASLTVVDSNNLIYLRKWTHEWASREIVLDKETYLPRQATNTIYHKELGLSQVHVFNFFFDKDCKIHDPHLSIDYYLTSGYTLTVRDANKQVADIPSKTLSPENISLLMAYPFLTTKGDSTFISSYESNYILLDFWFASCLPCLNGMPVINQLGELYADKGLQVLGINCFDKGISVNLESRFREKGISMPLLFGETSLLQSLGVKSFPTYWLVLPSRHVEVIHGDIKEVKKVLENVFKD